MAEKRQWMLSELETLPGDDLFSILDEIPSDNESIHSDYSEDSVEENNIMEPDLLEAEPENMIGAVLPEPDLDWESEDETNTDFRWSRSLGNIVNPKLFLEHGHIPDDIETPLELFMLLFSEELLEKIVFETNLYSVQKRVDNNYVPTTVEEMKCFLGINVFKGIKTLPSYKDYWSSRADICDHFISSCMSRNRFSWLLGNLHLNDNSLQPKKGDATFDKLYKLPPMLNKLAETYAQHYKASRCQSIDESMIRFKGRISFRQPIKRGYKMWVRANESGFVSQFQIYTGKVDKIAEHNLGKRVVYELTRDLVGKHHEVYIDNFFNSVSLQDALQKDDIYCCGTARKDRKYFPKDLIEDKSMQRGDFDWQITENGILALKWRDNKSVHFLGNFHSPQDVQQVARKQKDGSSKDYNCIKLVKDYNNNHMGYVDKSDMYKSCYEIDRKLKKWRHRIFWHFVDLTIVNAFLICKENAQCQGKSLSLKDFRIAVASGLIGADPEMPQKGRKSLEKPINKYKPQDALERRLSKAAHRPVHGNKVRCANCSTKKEPHRTRWHCSSCNVGLCLTAF